MTIWRRWISGGASAPARDLAGRFVPGGASALASPPAPGFPKKYTPKGRFRHKNRGIPRGVRRGGRALVSDVSMTWRFFSKAIHHLAAASREGASSVGYLGFCARIIAIHCTFLKTLRGRRPGAKDPAQRNLAPRMPAKGACLLASTLPPLSEGASFPPYISPLGGDFSLRHLSRLARCVSLWRISSHVAYLPKFENNVE